MAYQIPLPTIKKKTSKIKTTLSYFSYSNKLKAMHMKTIECV